MSALAGASATTEVQRLRGDVLKYKEESEKEVMEETSIVHHHDEEVRSTLPGNPSQTRD